MRKKVHIGNNVITLVLFSDMLIRVFKKIKEEQTGTQDIYRGNIYFK